MSLSFNITSFVNITEQDWNFSSRKSWVKFYGQKMAKFEIVEKKVAELIIKLNLKKSWASQNTRFEFFYSKIWCFISSDQKTRFNVSGWKLCSALLLLKRIQNRSIFTIFGLPWWKLNNNRRDTPVCVIFVYERPNHGCMSMINARFI